MTAKTITEMVTADYSALELRMLALRAMDVQPAEVPEEWVSQEKARSYATARLKQDTPFGDVMVSAGTLVAVRWERAGLDFPQTRGCVQHFYMVFVFGTAHRHVLRFDQLYDFR